LNIINGNEESASEDEEVEGGKWKQVEATTTTTRSYTMASKIVDTALLPLPAPGTIQARLCLSMMYDV